MKICASGPASVTILSTEPFQQDEFGCVHLAAVILLQRENCCIDFSFFLPFFVVVHQCYYILLCLPCIASWCSFPFFMVVPQCYYIVLCCLALLVGAPSLFFMDVPLCCWSHLHYIDSCFIVLLIDVFSHCSWLFHHVVFCALQCQ